jgi:predicted anti-sigma-YlaC factor YlaD
MNTCHHCRGFSDRVALMTAHLRSARPQEPVRLPVVTAVPRPARHRRRARIAIQGVAVAAVVTLALVVGNVRLDQPSRPPRIGAQASLASFNLRPLQRLHQHRNKASALYLPAVGSTPVGIPESPSGS